jgi:hypothetical protein
LPLLVGFLKLGTFLNRICRKSGKEYQPKENILGC